MDGSLDAVIGGGVLSEMNIALFKYNNSASVSVSLTESIQIASLSLTLIGRPLTTYRIGR